jgi:hypothetical protein
MIESILNLSTVLYLIGVHYILNKILRTQFDKFSSKEPVISNYTILVKNLPEILQSSSVLKAALNEELQKKKEL